MKKKPENCGACKHFEKAGTQQETQETVGFCKRYPPDQLIIDGQARTFLLPVPARFGCGEFRRPTGRNA